MKKLVLTACALTFAVSVFAQGTVVFNNRVVGTVVAPIYGPNPSNPTEALQGNTTAGYPAGTQVYAGPALLGANYQAELWGGAAGSTEAQLVAATGYSVATFRTATAGAGFWNPSTDAAIIPGVTPGSIATLQVRVWDKTTGTSWDNAATKGASLLFQSGALGGGIVTPPNLGFTDGTGYHGLQSFNAITVPEPSSFALAGLGVAALLIFRRRK